MRVAVHPCDDGACGWYRLRWPAGVLSAAGHDVAVEHELEALKTTGGALLKVLSDADVVVFQRPLDRKYAELIPVLQAHGHAVVVEIDDGFAVLPKGHPARRGTAVGNNPDYNRRWLRKACESADLVTVTTLALAEVYGAHGRVAVLPNLVPESYLSVQGKHTERPDVGWTGSVVTHCGDLDVMGGVIPEVLAETGARFVAWGVGMTLDALDIKGKVRPWADLTTAYPHQVAALDVGIVPLAPNPFNDCKSALKMSEYAALGVAAVASPTPDNRRVHAAGVGLLAETPDEWRTHLTRLLTDADHRGEVAQRSREAMRPLTYENRADDWLAAWCSAAENRVRAAA